MKSIKELLEFYWNGDSEVHYPYMKNRYSDLDIALRMITAINGLNINSHGGIAELLL